MTLCLHHLTGCAPAPLAHYLKALGILRIVAEQMDPQARGFWRDEHFCILTTLDREKLEAFFLNDYSPTPFVSPWNKGSGFFSPDDALKLVERSTAGRFECFRQGIAAARKPLSELAVADATVRTLKDRTKEKKGMTDSQKRAAIALKKDPGFKAELAAANRRFSALKADLFSPCAMSWRGSHRAWMDAAAVLPEAGKPSFPSLLGTGGNDGRVDFTYNAMQRLADLFDVGGNGGARSAAAGYLRSALWRTLTPDIPSGAIGQFIPGNAGGANATTGPDGGAFINPWDFVLMLEGTVLFSARPTRRLDPISGARASAPFAVRAHAIGHGSAGAEKAERGEQWMPLWANPTTIGDVQSLFGEARLQLARQVAHRPLDVARAISRVGVARGVKAFVRYGYLQRNGQANLAVPIGRVEVHERPETRLVDDLAPWLDRLQRTARDKNAPARLVQAERRLSDAVFVALTSDSWASTWQAVLRCAVDIEAIQATGTAYKAGPIPLLSPAWLAAADDGSVEWRLACSLGSAAAYYNRKTGRAVDPVRHHALPLQPGAFRFAESDKRLVQDTRVVMKGRDAIADLCALVQRRMIEGEQAGGRRVALEAAFGYEARAADLADLIAGRVDVETVATLAQALMAVSWGRARAPRRRAPQGVTDAMWPDDAWVALRLSSLPWPLEDGRKIPTDAAMLRRLVAGDGTSAVEIALRRLRASGVRPPLTSALVDATTSRLWAAALAFPISKKTATGLANRFESQTNKENR